MLHAASVVGRQFPSAAVAFALGDSEERVEAVLADLARRGLFLAGGDGVEWPDGTLSSGFAFRHQLYREVLYQDVTLSLRTRLHRRIGETLEAAHAGAVAPVGELAMHFRHGRDPGRAVFYLEKAAAQALRRSGCRDAVGYLNEALSLITGLEEGERAAWELRLQAMLGPALVFSRGWGAPEAELAYRRACELSRMVADDRRLSSAMFGLPTLLEFRGEFAKTQAILSQRLMLLEAPRTPPQSLNRKNSWRVRNSIMAASAPPSSMRPAALPPMIRAGISPLPPAWATIRRSPATTGRARAVVSGASERSRAALPAGVGPGVGRRLFLCPGACARTYGQAAISIAVSRRPRSSMPPGR